MKIDKRHKLSEHVDVLSCGYYSVRNLDTIIVRDGIDATRPILAQYCGAVVDASTASSGEHLYVEFRSDGKTESQGFAASFEFLHKSLMPTTPRPTAPGRRASKLHGKQGS